FDITTKIFCATTNGGSNLVLIPIKSSIKIKQNLVKAISFSLSIIQDFRELEKLVGVSEAIPIIRHNKNFNKYKLLLQKDADLQAATQFL
ncbi:36862_t:CDS:2, partial [Gigaspora margarita]